MDPIRSVIFHFFLLIRFLSNIRAAETCSVSRCNQDEPKIRFPFWVSDLQDKSCGFPRFNLSCSWEKQTLIEIPGSGFFLVKGIGYAAQELWLSDQDNCLPRRILSLNLSSSPFQGVYHQNFSFFNCSGFNETHRFTSKISCLSSHNYNVIAVAINGSAATNTTINTMLFSSRCHFLRSVQVPVQQPLSAMHGGDQTMLDRLSEDLRLTWFKPDCRACELRGQMCGLKKANSRNKEEIICSNFPTQGKSRKLPAGIVILAIVMICSPTITFAVVSLVVWLRSYLRRQNPNELLPTATTPSRSREVVGFRLTSELLSGIVIRGEEDVETTSDEKVCIICHSEIKPKESIASVINCDHCFHTECICMWLQCKNSCPICRSPVLI